MYAASVIDRRIANYERAYSTKLRDVPVPRVREIVQYLEGRRNPENPKRWLRPPVTAEFQVFIQNERARCKCDFLYWAKRYAFIQGSGGDGGYVLFTPWESQYLLLRRIAEREERMWNRRDAGDPSYDGICFLIHKARSLGFTMLVQLLLLHRAIFYGDTRTITVSVDDQKTQGVHKRWEAAYERLPYWMKPGVAERAVDRGKWLANGSSALLQDFAQHGGLGQGEQWDCAHLTEVASVPDDYANVAIRNHFLPTINRSIRGMAFMESTAQGFGNSWHKWTEQARRHAFDRWGYIFITWYSEPQRWARYDIPVGWEPSDDTRRYAKHVEMTSPEWMEGRTYILTRPQLYFYETTRESWRVDGKLREFLTNYCATPEESFQHSGSSAFNSEIIQLLSERVDTEPVAYELGTSSLDRSCVRHDKQIIRVANYDLVPVWMSTRDKVDPRGLFLIYDYPRRDVYYSIGGDPSLGIAGWHRTTRTDNEEEMRIDNSALEVLYRHPRTGHIRQAAEFAGPITPKEFAIYCLVMCHFYPGTAGENRGGALILEVYPGPGGQTQARMQYEMGFSNFYQWKTFNGMEVKETDSYGWVSNSKSVREAWIKIKELAEDRQYLPFRPQSKYLLGEMSYAEWDASRMRGMAMSGYHDDRISATLFATWQLEDWSIPKPAPVMEPVYGRTPGEKPLHLVDFQERDDVYDEDSYEAAVNDFIRRGLARVSGGRR